MSTPRAIREARRLGSVPWHALPCPSDADPGADDMADDCAGLLAEIESAQRYLRAAENALRDGDMDAAIRHVADACIELGVPQ